MGKKLRNWIGLEAEQSRLACMNRLLVKQDAGAGDLKLRNWIGLEAEQDRLKILLPPRDIHGIFRTSFSCEFAQAV